MAALRRPAYQSLASVAKIFSDSSELLAQLPRIRPPTLTQLFSVWHTGWHHEIIHCMLVKGKVNETIYCSVVVARCVVDGFYLQSNLSIAKMGCTNCTVNYNTFHWQRTFAFKRLDI